MLLCFDKRGVLDFWSLAFKPEYLQKNFRAIDILENLSFDRPVPASAAGFVKRENVLCCCLSDTCAFPLPSNKAHNCLKSIDLVQCSSA